MVKLQEIEHLCVTDLKNRTLIVFSPGFAQNEPDTTCIPALQQFVIELKKLAPDIEVKVLSLHYPFVERDYLWNGIECHSFGGRNRGGVYGIFLRNRVKRYLRNLIANENVSAILSIWMLDCALMAQEISNELKIPHFCWMHGQDAKPGNKFVSKIKPNAEQVIAISDILQKEFEKNYGIRSKYVIENGIGEELFPEFNSGERTIDVIGVGSLTAHKNYRLFIEVIAQLKKEYPSIKTILIGDGPERNILEQKIKQLDLSSNIELKGLIPRNQVLQFVSQAKIFLHTSSYEGSSGVIIEALYSGCHVVSTISVSLKPVKNVEIASNVSGLKEKISALLHEKRSHERVVYNTMKDSAEKMLSVLFKDQVL